MAFDLLENATDFQLSGEEHVAYNVEMHPDNALHIVENYNYKNQRRYNQNQGLLLTEVIKQGDFRAYTPIDFAVCDGVPHLVNGQHTLRAIFMSKQPVWLCVHFHRKNSLAEIHSLYSKYDTSVGRQRGLRDVVGELGDELGLNNRESDSLGVAVYYLHDGFRIVGGNDSPDRRYAKKNFELRKELMREWCPEAKMYFKCIKEAGVSDKALFYRSAIMAVALLTLREQPEKALPFWQGVAEDDGLRKGDPRKALINWLRHNDSTRYGYLQHRAASACWNAWYTDRQLTKVYPKTDGALKICGTPIHVKPGNVKKKEED